MACNILIAEDEEFIAKLYKFALEQQKDITVDVAHNGHEALEAIKKKPYQLLLLDLLMPDMDGFAVLTALKKEHVTIPKTVVLTNLSQNIDRKKCQELGAVDYLVKSDTGAEELWEKIRKYVPTA